jgi:hypothetical protein
MATRYAVANGNWSNTATWDGGTLPTSADDVHANNRTVTINQDVTVLSLRTTAGGAAVAGGTFNTATSGTINITANIIIGTSSVVQVGGTCICNITGNITGGASANTNAVVVARFGGYSSTTDLPVVTINGNILGGSASGAEGVRIWGGTLTINGAITGGTASTNAQGLAFFNSDNQPVKLTINNGPITGGSSSSGSTAAVSISTSPTGSSLTNSFININCNLVGGTNSGSNPALSSTSSIPITIVGNLTPVTSNGATINNSLVNISVTGNINGTGSAAIGLSIAAFNSLILNGNLTGGTSSAALNFTAWSAGATATVTGVITGGTANEGSGIRVDGSASSTGTLTVNGNCTSGIGGYAVRNFSAAAISVIINGNVSGAATGSSIGVVQQGSSSTMTINGTVTGGGVSAVGASNSGSGILIINGNVSAGAGSSAFGATNTSTGTTTINGDVLGGIGTTGYGASNTSTGRLIINGNVTGGSGSQAHGINNGSTGTVIVSGTVTAGTGNLATGITNASTGVVIVKRAKGNGYGAGSVGIQLSYALYASAQGSLNYVEEIEMGSRGAFPIFNQALFIDKNTNSATFYTSGLLSVKTLVDPNASGLMPSGTNVRSGIVYSAGNLSGTMIVPNQNSVAYGVPVDSGVGTAILRPQDVWDYMRINITGSGSIGERLKNSATISSVGDQIAAF